MKNPTNFSQTRFINRTVLFVLITTTVQLLSINWVSHWQMDQNNLTPSYDLPHQFAQAIKKGDERRVSQLLSQGVNPNLRVDLSETQMNCLVDPAPITVLMLAIRWNKPKIVSLLVNGGANISGKTDYGRNALHEASAGGKVNLLRFLLEKGGAINSQDQAGETPLMLALSNASFECASLLLARGANPKIKTIFGTSPNNLLATMTKQERQLLHL